MESEIRIDKWLWSVRVYKTRTLAADACRGGHVEIAGHKVKPSRNVKAGEIIAARAGVIMRRLKVIGAPPGRVGAKLVKNFAEDLTPASEYAKLQEQRAAVPTPFKGFGRPTKKARRMLERLRESGENLV